MKYVCFILLLAFLGCSTVQNEKANTRLTASVPENNIRKNGITENAVKYSIPKTFELSRVTPPEAMGDLSIWAIPLPTSYKHSALGVDYTPGVLVSIGCSINTKAEKHITNLAISKNLYAHNSDVKTSFSEYWQRLRVEFPMNDITVSCTLQYNGQANLKDWTGKIKKYLSNYITVDFISEDQIKIFREAE